MNTIGQWSRDHVRGAHVTVSIKGVKVILRHVFILLGYPAPICVNFLFSFLCRFSWSVGTSWEY